MEKNCPYTKSYSASPCILGDQFILTQGLTCYYTFQSSGFTHSLAQVSSECLNMQVGHCSREALLSSQARPGLWDHKHEEGQAAHRVSEQT